MNSWHLKENYDNVHIIKDSYTKILSLCKPKNKALLTQVHAIFNPLHSFFSKSLTKFFNTWMYKKLVRKIDIVFIKIVDFLTQSTANYIVKYCFIKSYSPL